MHFKTRRVHLCEEAVIQFIASNGQMYNLQTELRSPVIDSLVKVTPPLCFFSLTAARVALNKQMQSDAGEQVVMALFIPSGSSLSWSGGGAGGGGGNGNLTSCVCWHVDAVMMAVELPVKKKCKPY